MNILYPMSVPPEDHPLQPIVCQYLAMRDLSLSAERRMEELAPTPSTMEGDHPADALTGRELEYYTAQRFQCNHFGQAAEMLYNALIPLIEDLGGL